MMPPLPITLGFAVLFGYPLIQIAAILLRRRLRLRFNAIVGEMLADASLRISQKGRVRIYAEWSRGSISTFYSFPRLIWNMMTGGYTETKHPETAPSDFAEYRADASIEERLEMLRRMSAGLEMGSWPIAFTLVFPLAVGGWFLGVMAAKVQGAAGPASLSGLSNIRRTWDALHSEPYEPA